MTILAYAPNPLFYFLDTLSQPNDLDADASGTVGKKDDNIVIKARNKCDINRDELEEGEVSDEEVEK
jgi:hypothetical protein